MLLSPIQPTLPPPPSTTQKKVRLNWKMKNIQVYKKLNNTKFSQAYRRAYTFRTRIDIKKFILEL